MNVPSRYRLPIAILASVGVVVVVLVRSFGQRWGTSRHANAEHNRISLDGSNVHARGCGPRLLRGVLEARRTDDPSLVEPYVTSKQSSAYLSVAGFLGGQKQVKKASVTTVERLENIASSSPERRDGHLRLHRGWL